MLEPATCNTPACVFFTFFNLFKQYQIVQSITFNRKISVFLYSYYIVIDVVFLFYFLTVNYQGSCFLVREIFLRLWEKYKYKIGHIFLQSTTTKLTVIHRPYSICRDYFESRCCFIEFSISDHNLVDCTRKRLLKVVSLHFACLICIFKREHF